MRDSTLVKCIITFVFGLFYASCIWTIVLFPKTDWAMPAGFILGVSFVLGIILSIGYLITGGQE
jgi:hypothetical protein